MFATKFFTKVVVNRLKPLIPSIVSPYDASLKIIWFLKRWFIACVKGEEKQVFSLLRWTLVTPYLFKNLISEGPSKLVIAKL